jgi:hypothetical protein
VENMNSMIKTICRTYSWASPDVISDMFCDDQDYHGIEYWYNDVKEQHKEMNKKK